MTLYILFYSLLIQFLTVLLRKNGPICSANCQLCKEDEIQSLELKVHQNMDS